MNLKLIKPRVYKDAGWWTTEWPDGSRFRTGSWERALFWALNYLTVYDLYEEHIHALEPCS